MSADKLRYDRVFSELFELQPESLGEETKYQKTNGWDSVGHMSLVATLEDEFAIELDVDDIIDFSSYRKGAEILKKYGLEIEVN